MKVRLLLTAATLLSFGSAAHADTITIRGDSWCPYNCEATDAKPGYMIEVAKEIFEKAGHKIDYQTLTWARALEQVKSGAFNAVVGAAKDDAPELVYGKNPLGLSSNSFGALVDSDFNYKDVSSLAGKSIGVINGYSYVAEMDDYIAKNKADPKKVQSASGDDALGTNINKLVAKRIDLVLEDENVLASEIGKRNLQDKVKVVKSTLPSSSVYIAFSPANPKSAEYAALLDKGIDEMRASGRFAAILAKYNLKDWK